MWWTIYLQSSMVVEWLSLSVLSTKHSGLVSPRNSLFEIDWVINEKNYCSWDCPLLDLFQFKFKKTIPLHICKISPNLFFKITTIKRKKDAEIQLPQTLPQQWKIESFSRHQKGAFSSHSISSAWRSPSVAGCSETEGHCWPWTQTVRWVRTIQPYIISLSRQSKETLTEIKGKEGTVLKGCIGKMPK